MEEARGVLLNSSSRHTQKSKQFNFGIKWRKGMRMVESLSERIIIQIVKQDHIGAKHPQEGISLDTKLHHSLETSRQDWTVRVGQGRVGASTSPWSTYAKITGNYRKTWETDKSLACLHNDLKCAVEHICCCLHSACLYTICLCV